MKNGINLKVIRVEENSGLGNAMRVALDSCTFNLVARMDSDDISDPNRFERQLNAIENNPSADIIGGYMSEFVGEPSEIIGIRKVELDDADIKTDMKKRCGMNHVCVMFKKDAVAAAGGYLEWFCNEDYYLWIRMIQNGCVFANIPYVLVNVRTGTNMSARRGGWKYFRSEQKIQKYMLDLGMINYPRYIYNVAIRFVGEFLSPNWVRSIIYRLIRKKPDRLLRTQSVAKNENSRQHEPFSVIMSVYGGDKPEWFDVAMNSIVQQTLQPDEIVLVIDGPVPAEVMDVVAKYEGICNGL